MLTNIEILRLKLLSRRWQLVLLRLSKLIAYPKF